MSMTVKKTDIFSRMLWIILCTAVIIIATAGVFHFPEEGIHNRIDRLPSFVRMYVVPFFIGLVDTGFFQSRLFVVFSCILLWVSVAGVIFRIFSGEEKSYFRNAGVKEILLTKPEIAGFVFIIYMTLSAAFLSPSFFHGILSTVYFACCLFVVLAIKNIAITQENVKTFLTVVSGIGGMLALGLILKQIGWGNYSPDQDKSALPYWLSFSLIYSFVLTVRTKKKMSRVVSGAVNVLIAVGLALWGMNHLKEKPVMGRFADFELTQPIFGFGPGSVWSVERFYTDYPVQAGAMPFAFKGFMEFGIIGIVLFTAVLVPAMRLAYKNVQQKNFLTIFWLTFLVLLLFSCFSNPFESTSLMMLAAVSLGFCLSENEREAEPTPSQLLKNEKLRIAGAFVLSGILLSWLVYLISYAVINPFVSHVLAKDGRRWLELSLKTPAGDAEKNHRLNYARMVFRNAYIKDVFNGEAKLGQATVYKELSSISLANLEAVVIEEETTDTQKIGNALRIATQSHGDSVREILTGFEKQFPFNKDAAAFLKGESSEILSRAAELTSETIKQKEYREEAIQEFQRVRAGAPEYGTAQKQLKKLKNK